MGRIERVARVIDPEAWRFWDAGDQWKRDRQVLARIDESKARAAAVIAIMREPELPDDEVWSCSCCHQIVDRAVMERVALINAS